MAEAHRADFDLALLAVARPNYKTTVMVKERMHLMVEHNCLQFIDRREKERVARKSRHDGNPLVVIGTR